MPVVLSPHCQDLLCRLPGNKSVWKYMLALTQIPRGSNTIGAIVTNKRITAYLKELAEELGCKTYIDKGENLVIYKSATSGYENEPTICLQSHMDMICEKNRDVDIDFLNDPIIPRIDGDYLKGTGTSLGADNGIGVALCFAILEDVELKHGPLEILITRDDTNGFIGASLLESTILHSKRLINLDSKSINSVCVGSTGSFSIDITIPIHRESVKDFVYRRLTLDNFCGGHSGMDFSNDHYHCLSALTYLLYSVRKYSWLFVSIECDSSRYSIPRQCEAIIAIPANKAFGVDCILKREFSFITQKYQNVEENASFNMTDMTDCSILPCDQKSTKLILSFMKSNTVGVLSFNPPSSTTALSSSNCCIHQSSINQSIIFSLTIRSFSHVELDKYYSSLINVINYYLQLKLSKRYGSYCVWSTNIQSIITDIVSSSYYDVINKEAYHYSTHEGLTCSQIVTKYPGMDCVSIGPEIENCHSPNEQLLISSVSTVYQVLRTSLAKIVKSPKLPKLPK